MKIEICTCTKLPLSNFFKESALGKSITGCLDGNLNISVFADNIDGLSKCYNRHIEEHLDSCDMILFVHDDVSIDDNRIREKLNNYSEKFDILGLAGTSSWELKSPAVWNNSDPKSWSGAVGHQHQNETWMTAFGKIPKRCVIVDGLFIAVKTSIIKQHNLRFDEQFNFHHYDMDFCLSACQKGAKISTVPIWTTHLSIGDWKNDPRWKESETKFINKWK